MPSASELEKLVIEAKNRLEDARSRLLAVTAKVFDDEHVKDRIQIVALVSEWQEALRAEHDLPLANVDRTARDVVGEAVSPGEPNTSTRVDGQQLGYAILNDEERLKGFVRPVRSKYIHLKCGSVTTMGIKLSETYARDPKFYNATFCCACGSHYPVGVDGEFVWDDTEIKVGT